jgi:hypothetical protein
MRQVIDRATVAAYSITNEDKKALATEYLKVMYKIVDKGYDYVAGELARLDGLLASSNIPEKKKENLLLRKDIVHHFDYDIDILLGNHNNGPEENSEAEATSSNNEL